MNKDDFKNAYSLAGGLGIELGYKTTVSGGLFIQDMMKVKNFDILDWNDVFIPAKVAQFNLSIGYKAVASEVNVNSVAIGNLCNIVGDNVVQLGWVGQKVISMDSLYSRNDVRDMVEITDITLGREFIEKLRPVKYKLSLREEYLDENLPFPHPIAQPTSPDINNFVIELDDGTMVENLEEYNQKLTEYENKLIVYEAYLTQCNSIRDQRLTQYPSLSGVGTPQDRFTFGFVADEVIDAGSDDPDYRPVINMSDSNGYDAQYMAINELVPPLVKATQEIDIDLKDLRGIVIQHGLRLNAIDAKIVTMEEAIAKLKTDIANVAASAGTGGQSIPGIDSAFAKFTVPWAVYAYTGMSNWLDMQGIIDLNFPDVPNYVFNDMGPSDWDPAGSTPFLKWEKGQETNNPDERLMGKLQFKVKAIPGNRVYITTKETNSAIDTEDYIESEFKNGLFLVDVYMYKETSTLNLNQWMAFKVKLEGDMVAYLGLARDSRYRIRLDNLVAN